MEDECTRALLAGLAAGDERAFAALYDGWADRLFRAAASMAASCPTPLLLLAP